MGAAKSPVTCPADLEVEYLVWWEREEKKPEN